MDRYLAFLEEIWREQSGRAAPGSLTDVLLPHAQLDAHPETIG